ncbi:hypothetical protein VH567_00980 [Sphingomonas sp. 4RDLI-65]|uniref:hypothetical protein n=1 Tax=Sphingomonas sp. 4RDLI-65 TaxID=3111641 RepID=UPI003C1F8695
MFLALIDWIDRDWASRKYNPVFAFGQRFVWGVPVFISIAIGIALEALGYPSDGTAILVVVVLGAAGMFSIMLISLYRWAVGYSRSDFQERAAAEHRAQLLARHRRLRQLFNRNNG